MRCFTVYNTVKQGIKHVIGHNIKHTGHFISHHVYVGVITTIVCVATPVWLHRSQPEEYNGFGPSEFIPDDLSPPSWQPLFQPDTNGFSLPPSYDNYKIPGCHSGCYDRTKESDYRKDHRYNMSPGMDNIKDRVNSVPEPKNTAGLMFIALMLLGVMKMKLFGESK